MSRLLKPSRAWLVPTVAIAALAAGGIAAASIPDATGAINACYATTSGLLLGIPHSKGDTRLVQPGEACRSYEKAISWNSQGVKGDTGAAGPAGPGADQFGANTQIAVAGNGAPCTVGEIILSAGSVANGTPANGQLLPISENDELFALLGTTYGGNGTSNFALPNLGSAAPNGLTYSICVHGVFPLQP